MTGQRISDLTPGSPPYDSGTLLEVSVDAGSGLYNSRRARLADLGVGSLDVRQFDARTAGTVPVGTMVSLTRTGTIIDKVAPAFLVSAQKVIAAGTTSNGTRTSIIDMGSQNCLVAYNDGPSTSFITIAAASVSGDVITSGVPVLVASSNAINYLPCRLAPGLGVIAYTDSANASNLSLKAFSIASGTDITLGAAVTTGTTDTTGGLSIWRTSDTTFLLVYNDSLNSSRITVIAGSVSGTTITLGTKVQVSASTNNASRVGVAVLTATSFAVIFCDSTNTNRAGFVAGSLSGNTITLGTIVQASTGGSSTVLIHAVGVLDTTHFVIWQSSSSAGQTYAFFGVVAGTTVTVGAAVNAIAVALIGASQYSCLPNQNIFVIDSTHALFWGCYVTATGDTTGTVSTAGFVNNIGSPAATGMFLSATLGIRAYSSGIASTTFDGINGASDSQAILNVFPANSGGFFNFAYSTTTRVVIVGSLAVGGLVMRLVDVYGPGNPNTIGMYGTTLDAGSAGQSVRVQRVGTVTGLSGLTPTFAVNVQGDGTFNTAGIGVPVGLAVSSTSFVLKASLGAANATLPVVLTP